MSLMSMQKTLCIMLPCQAGLHAAGVCVQMGWEVGERSLQEPLWPYLRS